MFVRYVIAFEGRGAIKRLTVHLFQRVIKLKMMTGIIIPKIDCQEKEILVMPSFVRKGASS